MSSGAWLTRLFLRLRRFGLSGWFTFGLSLLALDGHARETCREPVGTFASIEGEVEVQSGGDHWNAVALDRGLCEGDLIRVRDRSRAAIQLVNHAVLRIDQNTTLRLVNITGKPGERSWIDLISGAFLSFSRRPWLMKVTTPHLKGDVDGTELYVEAGEHRSLLMVLEGRVRVSNDQGDLLIGSGQAAVAEAGRAPAYRILVRPRDAVRWALFYPPLIYLRPEDYSPGTGWREMVRWSTDFYRRGDRLGALEAIETVPDTVRDPRFYNYRAALLLGLGRADEARADIDRALGLAPQDSDALGLQSIIAVARNEKDRALAAAQRAVKAAPRSATARIALSYAQQARFDLAGARASLQKAVQLDPDNALAWARLAELWSSFGRLDEALQAAQKAAALAPDLSRTQTVLGFAYLTRIRTEQAKEAFAKAIALDQADPLPRLGLGLAEIREGDLHEGRQEIEVAASLDPSSAMVRSYLGKAYYEEKRWPLDERQYGIARELDPQDPTPWFYDAILKQTTNRPVEALHDLQTSIELNEDRAVYRSRLLLDSDLAARSASIGRIYSDLGFQQLALRAGWSSLNVDPSDFSAHRLLADSYADSPRHEIARVSELLQSQLLQPLNMTPIQPRLAESNLFLISEQGPGALSFNEFNPIFERDGITLQANSLAGENRTYAGEGILSGIYQNTSFSLGGFHFTTDGFRESADQRDDIANAFVQMELTAQTSVQAEYRYRNARHGDLQQRYFPEDFFSGLDDELESQTVRVGGRHAFSPDSMLLGSLIYQDKDARVRNRDFPERGSSIEFKVPENAFSVELQHLFRSPRINLQSGVGYSGIDRKDDITFVLPGADSIEIRSVTDRDLQHFNAYAYGQLKLRTSLTATLGLSFNSLTGDENADKNQVNPKFGITWTPFSGTTVRTAAFRTLKRTVINDQTLEPTQVAGFNQFFDDADLTEAWRYGGAIDQKLTRNLFAGAEFSKRDLDVPFFDVSSLEGREAKWQEYLGRAYGFWTPHPRLALRADYSFERFDRDERFAAGVRKLETHRVLFGMSWFDPSGLSATLTSTYWNQDGEFEGFLDPTAVRSGLDRFWTVDAAISYRLPKRYGFISVGATNLFNEKFRFFEVGENNPRIQPVRTFFVRLTLAFP